MLDIVVARCDHMKNLDKLCKVNHKMNIFLNINLVLSCAVIRAHGLHAIITMISGYRLISVALQKSLKWPPKDAIRCLSGSSRSIFSTALTVDPSSTSVRGKRLRYVIRYTG